MWAEKEPGFHFRMIRETCRAESIVRERAIAHFINGVSGQSLVNALTGQVPIDESTCPNARSGNPGVSCRTLGARDCGLLLRVIAATLAYRRQHVVLGRDGAVVGLTVLVEECVVLGTRIGTYV